MVLKNILHTLLSSGQDGQPCQHGPKPILLTDMVSTWKKICNQVYHAQRKQSPLFPPTAYQLKLSIFWSNNSEEIMYLYQSFPLRTKTVCLHPLGSQRTSTQWEFHITLFLLLWLLCREYNERVFWESTFEPLKLQQRWNTEITSYDRCYY